MFIYIGVWCIYRLMLYILCLVYEQGVPGRTRVKPTFLLHRLLILQILCC